jgi:type I restriction enzyme M protein
LIEAARLKISSEDAKALIEARFKQELVGDYSTYIRTIKGSLIKAVANLHNKYAVTVKGIVTERDSEAALLDGFMKGLGYE